MTGKVKKASDFLATSKWLFIFENANDKEYYVMTEDFYRKNHLKSPVTKRELDSLDVNMKVSFDFISIDDKNIVTKIIW